MRTLAFSTLFLSAMFLSAMLSWAQAPNNPAALAPKANPVATALVGRLDLERYKATIKGLTQFGDRRQGTARNRAAIDWIEEKLKSYGCTNTERIHYEYNPPAAAANPNPANQSKIYGPGGGRRRGVNTSDSVNTAPMKQPDERIRELDREPMTPG